MGLAARCTGWESGEPGLAILVDLIKLPPGRYWLSFNRFVICGSWPPIYPWLFRLPLPFPENPKHYVFHKVMRWGSGGWTQNRTIVVPRLVVRLAISLHITIHYFKLNFPEICILFFLKNRFGNGHD